MFERYTESARRALFFSRYEVSELGGQSIETEHLLLGLIRERSIERLVSELTHDSIDHIRREIIARLPPREKLSTSAEIPFSAETKRILEHAAAESQTLGDDVVASRHLLLGILCEEGCAAAKVLAAHGVRLDSARDAAERPGGPVDSV